MTDRELLKKAAKAAGYWSAEFDCPDLLPSLTWDPLTDDGDALRLAVKLRLPRIELGREFLGYNYRFVQVTAKDKPGQLRFFTEPEGADPCAATRRAIVLAAADLSA